MKVRCIGGPLDGQTHELERGRWSFEVEKVASLNVGVLSGRVQRITARMPVEQLDPQRGTYELEGADVAVWKGWRAPEPPLDPRTRRP